jgi:hypothetical protein
MIQVLFQYFQVFDQIKKDVDLIDKDEEISLFQKNNKNQLNNEKMTAMNNIFIYISNRKNIDSSFCVLLNTSSGSMM